MLTIDVKLTGIVPLFLDRIDEATLEAIRVGQAARATKVTSETMAQVCEKKLYKCPETGQLGIPAEMLWACFCEAGNLVKFDKMKKVTAASGTLLPLFLRVEETFFPFVGQPAWKPNLSAGRNNDGGVVPVVRPMFNKGWEIEVTLIVDESQFAVEKVEELVKLAGSAKGLGAHRPGKSRTGFFGRFAVTKWAIRTGSPVGNGHTKVAVPA